MRRVPQPARSIAALALPLLSLLALVLAMPAQAAPASSTADHSKFEELKVKFESGPEVTRACLSCHTDAAKQIHKTKHWTWDYENPVTGQRVGKRNVVNNFCISANKKTDKGCMSCHEGIERISDIKKMAKLTCVDCHKGDGDATNIEVAHAGMYANPSDLRVADEVASRLGSSVRVVTSAYRSPAYNARCRGAMPNSYHKQNFALDLQFHASPYYVARAARSVRRRADRKCSCTSKSTMSAPATSSATRRVAATSA